MKRHRFKAALCFVAMLLFTVLSFGQSKAKTVVTLIVNLSQIDDDPNGQKRLSFEIELGITLVNNPANQKFLTIAVNDGTILIWEGIITSEEVKIKRKFTNLFFSMIIDI